MKIKFCGAAENVTGSCHLVTAETDKGLLRILLDCGQFQGGSKAEAANFEDFPFNPAEIDFVILSHAHIDHCGRLPLLVKRGFARRIYCTEATADLLGVMLRDSAFIHEREAEYTNRKAQRAGKPLVEPLYTLADAEETLKYIVPVPYDTVTDPVACAHFTFSDAGHLLGSAITELWIREKGAEEGEERKIVFSGDLGVPFHPILSDPKGISSADILIMESTYGSRTREEHARESTERFARIIEETIGRGGTIVIPSFAVGRTQELIYELNDFCESGSPLANTMRSIKVYVDSPMAIAATEVFHDNASVFDDEYRSKAAKGDDPLSFPNLMLTKTTQESMALNAMNEPKIIISASGMCEAGRIRHHLKHHLWRPNSAVVFVGYQAEGTLGRTLIEGAKTVKLFGEEIYVNATIYSLEGYSGHADRTGLISWAQGFREPPAHVFLVHGEASAKESLAEAIASQTSMHPIVVTEVSEFEV